MDRGGKAQGALGEDTDMDGIVGAVYAMLCYRDMERLKRVSLSFFTPLLMT